MEEDTRRAFVALDSKLIESFGKVEREVWHLRIAIMLVLCVAVAGVVLGLAALVWASRGV